MDGEGEGGLKYWLTRGALIGLIVLGIGGRILMRIIAHVEHRPLFVFTVAGTLSVVLAGTVAGLFAGLIYYVTRRFTKQPLLRTALFTTSCELIVWREVAWSATCAAANVHDAGSYLPGDQRTARA